MGTKRYFIIAVGMLLGLVCNLTFATITYNDGQHHIISTSGSEGIEIDYQTPGVGTGVEVIGGGLVGGVDVYENGMFDLNGGGCEAITLFGNSIAYLNGQHGRLGLSGDSQMHIYYTQVD